MAVKPIPDGYHSITPYLTAPDAARLIEFLKQAFGAVELHRMNRPDGSIWHAEVRIGDSHMMLSTANEQWKAATTGFYLYVPDTDATCHRALEAGATSVMEPADQFYGDRNAGIQDPAGNYWWIATHKEDVSPEEAARRAAEAQKAQGT